MKAFFVTAFALIAFVCGKLRDLCAHRCARCEAEAALDAADAYGAGSRWGGLP